MAEGGSTYNKVSAHDSSSDESVLSDTLKKLTLKEDSCSSRPQRPRRHSHRYPELDELQPAELLSSSPLIDCSQLCDRTVKEVMGNVSFITKKETEHHWMDYLPDEFTSGRKKDNALKEYQRIIRNNVAVVAEFCAENEADMNDMWGEMYDCLKSPKIEMLMKKFQLEFKSTPFISSVKSVIQDIKDLKACNNLLTSDLGLDIQRNVSVIVKHVLQENSSQTLYNREDFKKKADSTMLSAVKDMVGIHAAMMIRYFVKLFCIEEAYDRTLIGKDDKQEVWKSIIVEIARFADVPVSLNDETKRFFFRDGERSVVVKADLEIMMRPSNDQYAFVPRTVVQVHCSHMDTDGNGGGEDHFTSAHGDSGMHSLPLTNQDGSSDSSRSEISGQLENVLPDCLSHNISATELGQLKKRLYGQHVGQLITVQQSMEYCCPTYSLLQPSESPPVIGLFVYNDKIVFTKLTGSHRKGRAFEVSNWCLHVDRLADRVLLIVFLHVYCSNPYNLVIH